MSQKAAGTGNALLQGSQQPMISSAMPPAPIYTDPTVIDAMTHIWRSTRNGTSGHEASFTLDGSPDSYNVNFAPVDREPGPNWRDRVQVGPNTFALFHVHPNEADPRPSDADMNIANAHGMKMYTISQQGLFQYDPSTKKTTQVAVGARWGDKPKR